jgi:CHAT domain-containing protein
MIGGEVRRLRLCAAMLLACGGAASPAVGAQTPAVPLLLRDGQPLSATHLASERFSYTVDATGPEMYLVRVAQRGLDLVATVTEQGGDGDSYDAPTFRDGSETIVLEPGRYRIDVRSDEFTGASGGHSIALTRLPAGTDARELEAWHSLSTGGAANFAGGEDGWARAVASYEHAATLWHDLGRTREEADALLAVASVEYWQLFAWHRSAELAARAAALYDVLGEAGLAANALHVRGAALVETALETEQSSTVLAPSPESEALFAEAFGLFDRARTVHERLGNIYDLALVENNFGYAYHSKGELALARPHFEQAVALFASVDEWSGELLPASNIAALDAENGELVSAIAGFKRVLDLLPANGSDEDRAIALDNLGATQLFLGEAEEALRNFATALELARELADAQGEGRSLRRIGETYYTLGELDLAKQHLHQALPIAVRTNDGRGQEAALRILGNVAFVERDYSGALDLHRRALEVAASIWDRAQLQLSIAQDLLALGRSEEALAAAGQAEEIATKTGSELLHAGVLNAIGRAKIQSADPSAATDALTRAAAIFADLGFRAEHAEALHGLTLAAQVAGQRELALRHGEAALRIAESLRAELAAPELRAFSAATRASYYETQIALLLSSGASGPAEDRERASAALEISERSRARMVADLLHEAAVDLRHDFDPALRARQRTLLDELAGRRHQRDLLLALPAAERAPGEVERVVADLASIENELNLLEIEMRRGSQRFAQLTAPDALTTTQMQSMLDANTVLLQYSLGADSSWLFAVTRDDVVAIELASRDAIEAAARRALAGLESRAADNATRAVADRALADLGALVVEPAAAYLERRHLVLALDGALQYVPFAVLSVRGVDGSETRLLESHEIVEIPSLTVLALAGQATPSNAPKTLAVFADPVLQPSDPRLGSLRPMLASADHLLAARSSVGAELGRLLSSGYEAEAITALVADDGKMLARGFAASRAAVLDTTLADYRYVHFATHGLVDSRYPGLSALVLSQFDEHGRAQDGFLRLNDIYNLRLNADVVVLSACETALGRDVRGEGLIGLTQGFLSAGARRLVASLWQVPDRATAELMTRFYGYLLNDGLRPAEALRQAQAWSAQQPRFRDPYFWGGFILVGDWR